MKAHASLFLLSTLSAAHAFAGLPFEDAYYKGPPERTELRVMPKPAPGQPKWKVMSPLCRVTLYDVVAGERADVNAFGQFTNDTVDKLNVGITTSIYICPSGEECLRSDDWSADSNADSGSEGNIDRQTHHQQYRALGMPAAVFGGHYDEVQIVLYGRAYNKAVEDAPSGTRNVLSVDSCGMQVRRWRP